MMDSELKKTSVRANTLEKKRYEMTLQGFDTAKRSVAVDMKKSQLYFKQRLKRYKDRQREILSTRSDPSSASLEEFVLRQLRRRTQMSLASARYTPRPQTWSHPQPSATRPQTVWTHPQGVARAGSAMTVSGGEFGAVAGIDDAHNKAVSTGSDRNGLSDRRGTTSSVGDRSVSVATAEGGAYKRGRSVTNGNAATSQQGESTGGSTANGSVAAAPAAAAAASSTSTSSMSFDEVEDFAKLSHCRRSKVDLRPCTAWSAVRRSMNSNSNSDPNSKNYKISPYSKSTNGSSNSLRLLQLRGGVMGTPALQTRYLDDEEIAERSTFYQFLLQGYRQLERQSLDSLNDRVEEFCGKHNTTLPSFNGKDNSTKQHEPLQKTSSVFRLSLPPGVPPIIHQAMKVGMTPSVNSNGNGNGHGGSSSLKLSRAKTQ